MKVKASLPHATKVDALLFATAAAQPQPPECRVQLKRSCCWFFTRQFFLAGYFVYHYQNHRHSQSSLKLHSYKLDVPVKIIQSEVKRKQLQEEVGTFLFGVFCVSDISLSTLSSRVSKKVESTITIINMKHYVKREVACPFFTWLRLTLPVDCNYYSVHSLNAYLQSQSQLNALITPNTSFSGSGQLHTARTFTTPSLSPSRDLPPKIFRIICLRDFYASNECS